MMANRGEKEICKSYQSQLEIAHAAAMNDDVAIANLVAPEIIGCAFQRSYVVPEVECPFFFT